MKTEFPGGATVLMAVYHRDEADLFRKAIDSVYANSLQPDELLLVCDGPLNAALDAVVAEVQALHRGRFRVMRLPHNRGLACALNAGLAEVRTEWVIRADSDDVNLPTRFATLASEIGTVDLIGSAVLEVDRSGAPIAIRKPPATHREILSFVRRRCPFNHMSVAYRTRLVRESGGYPNIHLREDYALWCKLIAAGARCKNTPAVLVHATAGLDMYRRRGGLKYALGEVEMQKFIVRCGLKSPLHAVVDGVLRASVYLVPAAVRGRLYVTFLRSQA